MEAALERRDEGTPRVPLQVLVELTHEDFDEPFEADGVNVGLGGLSMRTPYLPEVGAFLRCRFESPSDGRSVTAQGEVVWAQDSGPHIGEFGLRFSHVDGGSRDAIEELVFASVESTASDPGARPQTVNLYLEGVATPVMARSIHRVDDCMVLEQELPFLTLGKRVSEDGREGQLESVELRMVDGVPRLVLGVIFDDPTEEPAATAAPAAALDLDSDTLHDFVPPSMVVRETTDHEIDDLVGVAEHGAAAMEEYGDDDGYELEDDPEAFVDAAMPLDHGPAGDDELADRLAGLEEEGDEPVRDAPLAKVTRSVKAVGARLLPMWLAIVAFVRKATPMVKRRIGPALRACGRFCVTVGVKLAQLLRLRVGSRVAKMAKRQTRRRTTSPRRGTSNVSPRAAQRPTRTPAGRNRKRTIAISIAAFAGVGAAVWALTPSDGTAEPQLEELAAPPAEEAAPAPGPAQLTPEQVQQMQQLLAQQQMLAQQQLLVQQQQAAAAAQATGGVVVAPVAPVGPVTPQMPTALGQPDREAGQIARPTFPQVGGVPAPGSLPGGSPYAIDVRQPAAAPAAPQAQPQLTRTFGAERVTDGRSYTLRMSRRVQGIRGVASPNGFTVQIPGSLSLDRAGPIASSHPLIERAMVLNQGDHSELTIQFVDGQSPAYRVEARGSAVDITVARQ